MRVDCPTTDSPVWRISMSAEPGRPIVLSAAGLTQLTNLLAAAEQQPRCRVLVLEGSDGTFCRGMDLDDLVQRPGAHAAAGVEQYAHCLAALRGSSKAVMALVDGTVLAGGVGLAAAADLVLATAESTFGLPELVLGLVPAMVLPLLLERMPAQKARRLALLGQSIEAREAAALGLIDEVVDTAEALETAARRVIKALLRVEPSAVATLKALCSRVATASWEHGVEAGAQCTAAILSQPTRIAAVQAFVAGEPLPWMDRYRPEKGSR